MQDDEDVFEQDKKRIKLDMSAPMQEDEPVVDESLESRSMLVYGVESMKRMKRSNVFLSGLGGIGVEIAKNIALAGVKTLTLHDTKAVDFYDVGAQFYVSETDIGKNRATVSAPLVAELNPAVRVVASTDEFGDCSLLRDVNCVIMTDAPLELQVRVNEYCRAHQIHFLSADVRGAFCWSFTDLGDSFEVLDKDGEEASEIPLGSISHDADGVVSTLNETRHNLEDGDVVRFSEVEGMRELNGTERAVRVLTPFTFAVGDTSALSAYKSHGVAVVVKKPVQRAFRSLRAELAQPTLLLADFAKMHAPLLTCVGLQALARFAAAHQQQLPRPWHAADADELCALAQAVAGELGVPADALSDAPTLWRRLAFTARGSLPPLAAFLGGVVAQECLKSLSGKFSPVQQWLFLDAAELLPDDVAHGVDSPDFAPQNARFDALRVCVGADTCAALARAKLFMIGVGAIGCEMLKNFALLGVASADDGLVTVTDPDHIEKSNLNRQFLFRNDDIGHPKAERASLAAQRMHPQLKIQVNLDKVGPDTEATYDNAFYRAQSAVVNALDNVQARLYVDARCVLNQRALLESGTLGPKGHVQVIVPHLTESYSSQRDPPEKDVPFCTLKSFPSKLEHCIEWARDFSFGGSFVNVPETLNRLAEERDLVHRLGQPGAGGLDGRLLRKAAKAFARRPTTYAQCVQRAREVFEAHYKRKALSLLHTYPLDMVVDENTKTPFWSPPKKPPTPLDFDWADATHRAFVTHFAALYAAVWGVTDDNGAADAHVCAAIVAAATPDGAALSGDAATHAAFYAAQCAATKLEPFKPKKKKVVTDESVSKEDALKTADEVPDDYDEQLRDWCKQLVCEYRERPPNPAAPLEVAVFEKDDDANHHVDFIAAAANLRARMYGISEGDRLRVKGIAGRIMPAIATTTSCVSGLVAIELIKIVAGETRLERFKNSFMNLALPLFVLSEPQEAEKKKISDHLSITLWDSWEVRDRSTLQQLIDYFDEKYQLNVTGVTNGATMVYMSFLPMHKKRKAKSVRELCKMKDDSVAYVDLTIAFQDKAGVAVEGPAVRFWF